MSSLIKFVVSVCATHQPTEDGPRPLPRPFRTAFDRATREEAEALVAEFWAAAAETGMRPYLVTEIAPVRNASPVAGEILPGGVAILGERLDDVLDLDTWTETRFVTAAGDGCRAGSSGAAVLGLLAPDEAAGEGEVAEPLGPHHGTPR